MPGPPGLARRRPVEQALSQITLAVTSARAGPEPRVAAHAADEDPDGIALRRRRPSARQRAPEAPA